MAAIVIRMSTFDSLRAWVVVGACVLALPGCQRIDDGASDDDTPFDTDFTAGDDTDGPFLETGAFEDTGVDDPDDDDTNAACDPVEGTDCGAGEKCTAVLEGSTPAYACVSETGTQGLGQSCTVSLEDGLDGCTAGTVCLGEDAGTCRPLCTDNADCTMALCLEDPLHGIEHCAADCSPFGTACPSLQQCRRQGDRFSCVDALPADVGGAGEPCLLENDAGCGQGFMCVSGALVPDCQSAGCCTPLCDLSLGDTCVSPATCNAALESPSPGFESIGACFVPA